MAWAAYLDFNDGAGERNITALVLKPTVQRVRTLWKRLEPQSNYCTFLIKRDPTIVSLFLTTTAEIKVRIADGASAWFTGLVRKNFTITTSSNVEPVKVECVDYSAVWLKKKIDTTFAWAGMKICDPADTGNSIVHKLLTLAGYTSATWSISDTISQTIDYLCNVAGPDAKDYWTVLTGILFEYGWVWMHGPDGKFAIFNFLPASVASSGTLDNSVMRGSLIVNRQEAEYEATEVLWWTHKTEADKLVFQETRGATDGKKCNVDVAAGAHYPPYADADPGYAEYDYLGKEILYVDRITADVLCDAGITAVTLTNYFRRALVDYVNGGGSTAYIRRFDLKAANVTYKDAITVTKRMPSVTEKIWKFEAEYLGALADATKLTAGVYQYFLRSAMGYQCKSSADYAPGALVTVAETNLGISALCVVVAVTDGCELDTSTDRTRIYQLEGIAAYAVQATSSNQQAQTGVAADPSVTAMQVNQYLGKSSNAFVIGYAGTGTPDAPVEGDRRAYIDEDEIGMQVYTNAAWAEVRSVKFGGVDSNGNYLPFLSCRGLLGSMGDSPADDPLPDASFYRFNFDDNVNDQNGANPWTVVSGTITYVASPKWEGTKALTGADSHYLQLKWNGIWTVGSSFSVCTMWYRDLDNAISDAIFYFYYDASNYISGYIRLNKVYFIVAKGGVTTILNQTLTLPLGAWYFVGIIYNSATTTLYIRISQNSFAMDLSAGTWATGAGYLMLTPRQNNGYSTYLDDLIFSPTVAVDPEVFLQHVNRGRPWDPTLTAKDLLLRAQAGGSIRTFGPMGGRTLMLQ
jgi:hypothetical protein